MPLGINADGSDLGLWSEVSGSIFSVLREACTVFTICSTPTLHLCKADIQPTIVAGVLTDLSETHIVCTTHVAATIRAVAIVVFAKSSNWASKCGCNRLKWRDLVPIPALLECLDQMNDQFRRLLPNKCTRKLPI